MISIKSTLIVLMLISLVDDLEKIPTKVQSDQLHHGLKKIV